MIDLHPMTRALISVSDKTGLVALAKELIAMGITILSTGGSADKLRQAGLPVTDVSDVTGFPEMMEGRIKTLHPKIHGGLLQRRDSALHQEQAQHHQILPIDLLVVNLYPFRETVQKGADYDTCIENIDIGGPAMVRAGAKNHDFVTVVTSPAQYGELLDELRQNKGATPRAFRQKCAAAAYAHTASYDAAVSAWFAEQLGETYPQQVTLSGTLRQPLRYGENPHQTAAFYVTDPSRLGIASALQVQGKELSYNNIADTDAAFDLVSVFTDKPAVAIIKHANPCGVATGTSLLEAYQRALLCDPVSAFGGIIACNRPLDAETATAITQIFSEVIIAPDADDAARAIVAAKKNLRLLLTNGMPQRPVADRFIKNINGGFLLQSRDTLIVNKDGLKCVTKRQPTDQEMHDLIFAFSVAKHVKSNTIVYAKNEATVGIGAGQMSRVDAARIAAHKAEEAAKAAGLAESLAKGSVVASDAFFPFADGLLSAIEAGATAVIQPGGSLRDAEIIKAADDAGIAMVLTGIRHFYH